jgi:hypothetical protein
VLYGSINHKLECVHISELERLHRAAGALNALWPHTGRGNLGRQIPYLDLSGNFGELFQAI